MDTSPLLYRDSRRLSAVATGEPSVTLIRNDTEFALLLADGAHEESFTGRLHLDGVSHLRVFGQFWSWTDFASVSVYREDDLWLAQDAATRRFFRNPSWRPYCVLFIGDDEHRRLRYCRAEGLAGPVFRFAQSHFGRLPGFAARDRALETPDDYATADDAIPPSLYTFAPSGPSPDPGSTR